MIPSHALRGHTAITGHAAIMAGSALSGAALSGMPAVASGTIASRRHAAIRDRRRAKGQSEILSTGFARIAIAITIIAAISAAVALIMTANSDAMQSEIETIDQIVTKNFGAVGVYAGLNDAYIIGTAHVPSNYYTGSNLITPWHSKILLNSTKNPVTGIADGAWTLEADNTPSGECNDLAVEHFTGQIAIAVGGRTAGGTTGMSYVPPTPIQAESACGGASGYGGGSASGSATMLFTFGGN